MWCDPAALGTADGLEIAGCHKGTQLQAERDENDDDNDDNNNRH